MGLSGIGGYRVPEFDLGDFPAGWRVLDVGCGSGWHLRELRGRGVFGVGLEPDGGAAAAARAEGFEVVEGFAEALPWGSGEFDGILASVVLPYTDERRAIVEWGRVLRSGGEVRASYHGLGYGLRYLLRGETWRMRFYGGRMLANTAWYRVSGRRRRLPGSLGDTLCQTSGGLRASYREAGLEVLEEVRSRGFGGREVFLYHRLRKI